MEEEISNRKKEHIELCLTDKVAFNYKSNGFDNYDFVHYAITEVKIDKIDLSLSFLNKKISFPFLISCMTGGTDETNNINLKLANVAEKLKIPIGLGSQRYALRNKEYEEYFYSIRNAAPSIPLLGNIGAAQILDKGSCKDIIKLIKGFSPDGFVVHLNPLQELMQPEGEPNFFGLLAGLEYLIKESGVPIIIKEVGSGISLKAAKKLLQLGVYGIDTAGAGGTSWAGVEILRRELKGIKKEKDKELFWDWGLPTSFCVKELMKLKGDYDFYLIGSGGINNSEEAAKCIALGADLVASARKVLTALFEKGEEGVVELIEGWFEDVKKIMFLTGSQKIKSFRKKKVIEKRNLF